MTLLRLLKSVVVTLALICGPHPLDDDFARFTITNSTGASLQLNAAEFATNPINTSIDDYVLGANNVDYTDMVVTPSNGTSGCGNRLANGASCEITMQADTVGTLTVT